jgi:uncharacterized protein (UPF0332 family)
VKPEAAEYLAKVRECLDAARKIIAVGLPQVAAKEGYLAAYHAAHAFVFENTRQVVKSHSGMRVVFACLAKAIRGLTVRSRHFLHEHTRSRRLLIMASARRPSSLCRRLRT